MDWLNGMNLLVVGLAGLFGFTVAWLWQRKAFVTRVRSLSEELALCRSRTAEIDKERKQAIARLAPLEARLHRTRFDPEVGACGPVATDAR